MKKDSGIRGIVRGLTIVGTSILAGCAGKPVLQEKPAVDPQLLLKQVCEAGKSVQRVKGSVWLKAKSKEASGQFPAMVEAAEPDHLRMEVTNLLGGTEAIISVDGRNYTIDVPNHKSRNQKGSNSWGGIPLEWANSLFLGKVPCPPAVNLSDAVVSVNKEGDLTVETKSSLEREAELVERRARFIARACRTGDFHEFGRTLVQAGDVARKGCFLAGKQVLRTELVFAQALAERNISRYPVIHF